MMQDGGHFDNQQEEEKQSGFFFTATAATTGGSGSSSSSSFSNTNTNSTSSLLLGDVIRVTSVSAMPMYHGADLSVVYIDPNKMTLVVIASPNEWDVGSRRSVKPEQFQAEFRNVELISRAAERGFARQNGLAAGTWIRLVFMDDTEITGKIVELANDRITLRPHDNENDDDDEEWNDDDDDGNNRDLYIDFAYRGFPDEMKSLCIVGDPTAPAASSSSSLGTTAPFAPEPMDITAQLLNEAAVADGEENFNNDFYDDYYNAYHQDAAAAATTNGNVFTTVKIGAQVDAILTATLSRVADKDRTITYQRQALALVQRYRSGRRTAMVLEGDRAVRWIVPPPVPVSSAWTEQQSPIGDDLFGERRGSTKVQPLPAPPLAPFVLPVVAVRQRAFMVEGEVESFEDGPEDVEMVDGVRMFRSAAEKAQLAAAGPNDDRQRCWRVTAESLKPWEGLNQPWLEGRAMESQGPLAVVPEIRSRRGIEAVISNFELNRFEHSAQVVTWDNEPVKRRKTGVSRKEWRRSVTSGAKKNRSGRSGTKKKQQQQKQQSARGRPNVRAQALAAARARQAFDDEASEASSVPSEAEQETFSSDDDDDNNQVHNNNTKKKNDLSSSIDFGSDDDDDDAFSRGGRRNDDDDDSDLEDDDEAAASDEDEEDNRAYSGITAGGGSDAAVFVARRSTVPVHLLPPYQMVRTKHPRDPDGAEFSALPSADRLIRPATIAGDGAAVRSVLCLPVAPTSARHSLFERIRAADGEPLKQQYIALARGRAVVNVTNETYWNQQQQQQQFTERPPLFGTVVVHAALDTTDPVVAALDDADRLEMLLRRTVPTSTQLLSDLLVTANAASTITSLDRVVHALAPFGVPSAEFLAITRHDLRRALRQGQRMVRLHRARRAEQVQTLVNAQYRNAWTPPAIKSTMVDHVAQQLLLLPQNKPLQQGADNNADDADDDYVLGTRNSGRSGSTSKLAQLLREVYASSGRRGVFAVPDEAVHERQGAARRLVPHTSEQLLGWLQQDGGTALAALVAFSTNHLTVDVPLLLNEEDGSSSQRRREASAGMEECAPRVLAKTYPSVQAMLADTRPMFDADLDPVDYQLAREIKSLFTASSASLSSGSRSSAAATRGEVLYDFMKKEIERRQSYGPRADYARMARSMVDGAHPVSVGNYAAVEEPGPGTDAPPNRLFYRWRITESGGGAAVWVRDPLIQNDAAFMSTANMLCEIRSLRATGASSASTSSSSGTGANTDDFCLATKTPPQSTTAKCMSAVALIEQKRTALLDELFRRQKAAHRVSADQWLALARKAGRLRVGGGKGGGGGATIKILGYDMSARMYRANRTSVVRAAETSLKLLSKRAAEAAEAANDNDDDMAAVVRSTLQLSPDQSPYFSLWCHIDGGETELGADKRFAAIVDFARMACRAPMETAGESPYWLVCNQTGAPLVPIVQRDLAAAYRAGGEAYTQRLQIALNSATVNDEGNAYLDRATGVYLCDAAMVSEYRFDVGSANNAERVQTLREEGGTQLSGQERERRAAEIREYAAAVAAMENQSEDTKFLSDHILVLLSSMSITVSMTSVRRTAMLLASRIVMRNEIVPTAKSYDRMVQNAAASAAAKGKQPPTQPSYEEFVRQIRIGAAAVGVLIAIQTHAQPVVARNPYLGNKPVDFSSSYPLVQQQDNNSPKNTEALLFMARILETLAQGSSSNKYPSIFRGHTVGSKFLLLSVLEPALKYVDAVQTALREKRAALSAPAAPGAAAAGTTAPGAVPPGATKNDGDDRDDTAFFLPPLRPLPVSATAYESSTGKIRVHRLGLALVQALRIAMVHKPLLMLSRKDRMPFMKNACCAYKMRAAPLHEFCQESGLVQEMYTKLVEAVKKLRDPTTRGFFPTARRTRFLGPRSVAGMYAAATTQRRQRERRSANVDERRRLLRMSPLDRVRAAVYLCGLFQNNALSAASSAASSSASSNNNNNSNPLLPPDLARLCPANVTEATVKALRRIAPDALSSTPLNKLRDRDDPEKTIDAEAQQEIVRVADHMTMERTQAMFTAVFRKTLLPPSANADVAAAFLPGNQSATPATSPFLVLRNTTPETWIWTRQSLQLLDKVSRKADAYEAAASSKSELLLQPLRNELYAAISRQMGMLQYFLLNCQSSREPDGPKLSSEVKALRDITDYATLLSLGGRNLTEHLLGSSSSASSSSSQASSSAASSNKRRLFFRPQVLAALHSAVSVNGAANSLVFDGVGVAQMNDYFTELSNLWGCVYPRKMQKASVASTSVMVLPSPHGHWKLQRDDTTFLRQRLDMPFRSLTEEGGGTNILAMGALAAVASPAKQSAKPALSDMWRAVADRFTGSFRAVGDAFRRRALAWIPSSVDNHDDEDDENESGANATGAEEFGLAQMVCLSLLLHVCVIGMDASGFPETTGELTAVAQDKKYVMETMALYISRLTNTLRTGEKPTYLEPVATTYRHIAEKVAFSKDREKDKMKDTYSMLATDPDVARIERLLRKNRLGKYHINRAKLNVYGAEQGHLQFEDDALDGETALDVVGDGDDDADDNDDRVGGESDEDEDGDGEDVRAYRDEDAADDGYDSERDGEDDNGNYYAEH